MLSNLTTQKDIKVTIQALGKGCDGGLVPLRDDASSVAYWYSNTLDGEYPEFPTKNKLEII